MAETSARRCYAECGDDGCAYPSRCAAVPVIYRNIAENGPKPGEHWSDCAVHSEPAFSAGRCNCGAEADHLLAGIREIIAVCDQDACDQDPNATQTGFGRYAKAYAEGRGTACKGIATRLRALLPKTP